MNSISIRTALTGLFALMILMICGLGYVAITEVSLINKSVEAFADDWFPSLDSVSEINDNVSTFRIRESRHILSDDPGYKKQVETSLSELDTEFRKDRERYESLLSNDEERRLYRDVVAGWNQYKTLHTKILELSRANQHAEAFKIYGGESKAAFDEVGRLLHQLIALNREGGKREATQAAVLYNETIWRTSVAIGASLFVAFGAMIFSFFGVSRPIGQITRSMRALAAGDTATPIPFEDRRNEVGAMANAVQIFKDNMIRARALEAEADDVKTKAEADRKRAMQETADQFERSVGSIVQAVSDAAAELQSSAQALSSSSSETTHQSTVVAAASEQAAANVRTVAAAAEQLSGSVREISRQVSMSSTIARKAVEEAEQTNEQVSGLSVGAQKIGAIVDLINDIASKTNLLALNATIEAARAGEAGRGFAVVAQEVKALAEQTGKATAEITSHIASVQTSTDQAASAILGIGKTIDEINQIAAGIAAAVEEQGAATEEIARNVDQAAQGTTEVTRNITGVNQAAESSSASANHVLSAATELSAQSNQLRSEMQKFLTRVRAA